MENVEARWILPNVSNSSHVYKKKTTEKEHQNVVIQNQASKIIQNFHLVNLNIDFPKEKLIGVIGHVGAGKSSLLNALLRELTLECGSISINGSISYAAQEAWVFNASVRQNILFGKEYDRDRYDAVIRSCALTKDFEQFENGELTIVGERGTLSGGQRARIK